MLAIKADYNNGKITFIDAMPERIKKARLTIVVESDDNPEKPIFPSQELNDSAAGYRLIGLPAFFDIEEDKNINWEDYFGLKY